MAPEGGPEADAPGPVNGLGPGGQGKGGNGGNPSRSGNGKADGPYHALLLDVHAGAPEAFLHPDDASAIGVLPLDRLRITVQSTLGQFPAVVNVSAGLVPRGSIGLSKELAARMQVPDHSPLDLRPAPRPASVAFIRRKLDGLPLTPEEVAAVIQDIAGGHLTSIELTCWAAAVHTRGLSIDETVACVQAMVDTGERLDWDGAPCYDVHSIGGVPGNKYAPIVVSIVAAAGLRIPKTSSRAISSACGTADFMEVLAPVALDASRLKAIVQEVGATLAWGGGFFLAPADDEIIRVEYPLGLDPPAQVVASVLAKKVAMGVTHVLIDLPMGPGAKVHDHQDAGALAHLFGEVGRRLGLTVRCELTPGGRPLGLAVGPTLEAREMLATLEAGDGPSDLVSKSALLAGRLLEMGGKAGPGQGPRMALAALHDGTAHRKLLDILRAQGGDAGVRAEQLHPGPHHFEAVLTKDSRFEIDNAALVSLARAAGAPHAKGAGVQLLHPVGEPGKAGETVLRVYAETPSRLANAWDAAQRLTAFECRPSNGGPKTGT